MDVLALAHTMYWLICAFFVIALFTTLYENYLKGKFPIKTWQKACGVVYLLLAFVSPAVWTAISIIATLLLIAANVPIGVAIIIAIVALFGYVFALFLLKLLCQFSILLFWLTLDSIKSIRKKIKNRRKIEK